MHQGICPCLRTIWARKEDNHAHDFVVGDDDLAENMQG